MHNERSRFLTFMLYVGLAFLYIPMVLLVIYSFNYSKLVPVWGGWSTRWYKVLFESPEVWEAVSLSLQIAFINATLPPFSVLWQDLQWFGLGNLGVGQSLEACWLPHS